MKNSCRWCFSWPVSRKSLSGKDRAALVKASQWNSGQTITISFLDGDPSVQKRVQDAAAEWTAAGLVNLAFDFRKGTNEAMVRISFQYDGSWSVIGTTCRQVTDKSQPTMNFGWLNASSDDKDVQGVVLHEFGHAIGLIHEHQNPAQGIQWNRQQVIQDLSGPPNNWSLDTIDHNMFEPYAAAETNFTKTDPDSIMMYPIPANWTLDGFTVGLNSKLSPIDKSFIHTQYA